MSDPISILIIAGIVGVGYLLNKDGKEERNAEEVNNNIPNHETPLSYDIYNSNNLRNIINNELTIGNDLYNKSLDPRNTGIINPVTFHNSQSMETNFKNTVSQSLQSAQSADTTTEQSLLNNEDKKNMALPSNFFTKTSPKSILKNLYEPKLENFGHRNMYPSYRGNQVKQSLRENISAKESIPTSKRELKSFGVVEKNIPLGNALVDIEHERFPANIGNKQQGIRLMEPIRVAPNSSGDPYAGYEGNFPMNRPYVPTVDDLRSKSNPKLKLDTDYVAIGTSIRKGPTLVGKNIYEKRGIIRDLNYDFHGPSSATKQQTLQQNYNTTQTMRGATNQDTYFGNASGNSDSQTIRETFFTPDSGNRENETNRIGIANKLMGFKLKNNDPLKTTLRETTESDYIGQSSSTNKKGGYELVNQNNKTTLREFTEMDYTPSANSNSKQTLDRKGQYNNETNLLKSISAEYTPSARGISDTPNPKNFHFSKIRSIRESDGKDTYLIASGPQKINTKINTKIITYTRKVKEFDPERINNIAKNNFKNNKYAPDLFF